MEEKIYRKTKKMEVLEYSNGVILPRKMTTDGPSWGLGGICNSNNEFQEQSLYDGGWTKQGGFYPWNQKKEQYMDVEVVYIGLFFAHWGHFLVDLLGRAWYLNLLKSPHIKIAYIGEEELSGNYLEFFHLLGITQERILHVTSVTRFKKVILPEMSFRACIWYTKEFQDMFDYIISQTMADRELQEKFASFEKVYFTRRNFRKAKASEFGEKYFERCFVENGYQAIAPEILSLKEQIYLWNKAKSIVCMNGSIVLNVVFSTNSKLDLVVLNKMSLYHKNPYILLNMRHVDATFIDIYKEPLKEYPKSLGEGPYLLHVGKTFKEFCQSRNMIIPYGGVKLKIYEIYLQMRYYMCVMAIDKRIRSLISKVVHR